MEENNEWRKKDTWRKNEKREKQNEEKLEQEVIKMRCFSVLRNLVPYKHLFSARECHILAAGALLLQMAAITRQCCRSTVMNSSIRRER